MNIIVNPISLNMTEIDRKFATYNHATTAGVFYVGCCPLRDVLAAPDARYNSEWQRIMRETNGMLTLTVEGISDSLQEAQEHAKPLIDHYKPHCNLNGTTITPPRQRTAVKCLTNGWIYANAAAACAAHNIKSSALSNHLNRKPGYNTVHGLQFERVEP